MDILTSIPVQVSGPESIPCVVNNVKERIARRAYESFVERGSVHGHELDDWLRAERELENIALYTRSWNRLSVLDGRQVLKFEDYHDGKLES